MNAAGELVALAGGRRVLVRPVQPGDLLAMNTLLMGLSPRSRRLRFHGAVNALPCTALRQLSAADDEQHATLVAWARADDSTPRLVAEARWVRDAGNGSRAEFALSVADDWQGLGLARALLHRLRRSAADAGVQSIYGSVLEENRAMLALLASLAARPQRDHRVGHGLVWCLDTMAASPVDHRRPTPRTTLPVSTLS